jgi:hypothetical protein
MPKAKTALPDSPAALLKLERERDKVQATAEYEANRLARNKNMHRLRDLRLAREAVVEPTRAKPSVAPPEISS